MSWIIQILIEHSGGNEHNKLVSEINTNVKIIPIYVYGQPVLNLTADL